MFPTVPRNMACRDRTCRTSRSKRLGDRAYAELPLADQDSCGAIMYVHNVSAAFNFAMQGNIPLLLFPSIASSTLIDFVRCDGSPALLSLVTIWWTCLPTALVASFFRGNTTR